MIIYDHILSYVYIYIDICIHIYIYTHTHVISIHCLAFIEWLTMTGLSTSNSWAYQPAIPDPTPRKKIWINWARAQMTKQ